MSIHARSTKYAGRSQRRARDEFKRFLVTRLGGKCILCGYDRHVAALDFDHIDPSTKENTVSFWIGRRKWDKALAEADRCRLLCSNCHREQTHLRYGEDTPPRVLPLRRDHPLARLTAS